MSGKRARYETLEGVAELVSLERVLTMCDLLDRAGIRFWVMGGWGVDALLGDVTRRHKDLDLLLLVADLPAYERLASARSWTRSYTWSENVEFELDGRRYDSAFVDADPEGAELDVHVIDVSEDGKLIQYSSDPWPLPPKALAGMGQLAGRSIRCVSADAQLAMHTGYDLPDAQRHDLERLRRLRTER